MDDLNICLNVLLLVEFSVGQDVAIVAREELLPVGVEGDLPLHLHHLPPRHAHLLLDVRQGLEQVLQRILQLIHITITRQVLPEVRLV